MKCFDEKYNSIPKVELHCHLEGAIRTATIIDIARDLDLPLPSFEESILDRHVKVLDQMKDLASVLDAFAIARRSIASPEIVERIAWEMFVDAARQNIKLLEVRFSPDWAFSANQVNWDDALDGMLRARQRAEQKFDMAIGFIAITSRSLGVDSARRTFDWAIDHQAEIHGIDLADCEINHPIRHFADAVSKAQRAGLSVTVHSGEDTQASDVVETIRAVNPQRIGHGTRVINDVDAVAFVKARGVVLEMNPWSNYLTNSVRRIEDHPLKKLFDLGVKVTINSDDPELLDTNLNNEFRIAHEILGFSLDEIRQCNRVAAEASFLPEAQRRQVIQKYFS